MKKLMNKNSIFCFILGGLIFGSIGIYAASMYNSKDISYSNKNFDVNSVKDALDDLYGICGEYKVQLQYRIENKTYEIGESVNWAGQNWYAINNDSNSVTLILKSNYATGSYGSNTTFEGSTAFDKVNVDFVNNNGQIIDAINSGAVVQQGNYNNEPYYVRLPEQTELSSSIPNSSNTSFWTKTVNGSGLYFGLKNGTQGLRYLISGTTSCYQGRNGTSISYLQRSYSSSVANYNYLTPDLTSISTSYSTGTIYCSNSTFYKQCDTDDGDYYCTETGVSGCGWSKADYGAVGDSTCKGRTVYTLSSAETIGYRPVITVYKK